ncbi:DNA replication/repair protein RecF [Demequina sp. SYSU T00039]|uniref:DNA replication and repair protein RecF n=1 Tax=Demequina lignilytica TaxID=3051663 RepID=A0AAW7M0H8_9MICO|nr:MULTISPECIES: DNA replication/repair protein RecF [unclassified Demequina]MDN4477805.1 DNA replication/repair protein RecF [Demequina sp. SYSU T00039-1]MDN4487714.1 DNA replication/repair protein RecF [Demequina sp. SYSU T00039]MDN4490903.1 DNA replication/repair protein RecF [Demequina sp. SYSU T00068]
MRVTHLQLADFRSYAEAEVELGAGVTTFVGRNGQGKTNLVEALRYLSVLGSHRVASDAPLIRFGAERAVVRAKVEKSGRSLALEVTLVGGRANQARLGRAQVRPRELIGILRTVLFAPEDLSLVKGDPGGRRQFMDELCVAMQPTLAGDLADYDRVLRQRGSMLKTSRNARGDLTMLDIWDEKLADLGGRIVAARLRAVAALAPHVWAAYLDVAPDGGDCRISYATSLGTDLEPDSAALAGALLDQLRELRPKELERGVNLAGPHRDDLEIRLGEMPAKGYASHGESWSCALALRIGTYDLLTSETGPDSEDDGEPVLILDDVFAELDSTRRSALASRLERASQVLITAAVADDVPAALAGAVIPVTKGHVGEEPAHLDGADA